MKAKVKDFSPDKRNANKGSDRGRALLKTSLEKLGAGRSILVDKNGSVIAGNKTREAAIALGLEDAIVVETDGTQLVVVKRTDLNLDTDATAKELAIADNRAGELGLEWDAEIIAELNQEIDLSDFFTGEELGDLLNELGDEEGGGMGDEGEPRPTGSLFEKFLVPPFSVMDARQGYWQKRKQQWLALGIQSELGRGGGVTWGNSEEVTSPGLNYYRDQTQRREDH